MDGVVGMKAAQGVHHVGVLPYKTPAMPTARVVVGHMQSMPCWTGFPRPQGQLGRAIIVHEHHKHGGCRLRYRMAAVHSSKVCVIGLTKDCVLGICMQDTMLQQDASSSERVAQETSLEIDEDPPWCVVVVVVDQSQNTCTACITPTITPTVMHSNDEAADVATTVAGTWWAHASLPATTTLAAAPFAAIDLPSGLPQVGGEETSIGKREGTSAGDQLTQWKASLRRVYDRVYYGDLLPPVGSKHMSYARFVELLYKKRIKRIYLMADGQVALLEVCFLVGGKHTHTHTHIHTKSNNFTNTDSLPWVGI